MKAPASLALPGALAALLAMGLAVLPSGGSLGAFSSVLTTLADAESNLGYTTAFNIFKHLLTPVVNYIQ